MMELGQTVFLTPEHLDLKHLQNQRLQSSQRKDDLSDVVQVLEELGNEVLLSSKAVLELEMQMK